jgi:MoaA/NifB/PqqE/SkfB family radical SAM enzyme
MGNSKKILVNLEATPNCPASCSMCPRSKIDEYGFAKLETIEKIVSQVDPTFVWELDLAGRGEPTIHPEFHEILKIMRKPGVPTAVVTTAVAINNKKIDGLVNNVDLIRLSVSSINKQAFDKVHIGLDHEKIWNNIERISEAARKKVKVHLTGGPDIFETLPQTVDHLRKMGLENIYLFPLWNRGGNLEAELQEQRRLELVKSLELSASESEYNTGMGKFGFIKNAVIGRIKNKHFCAVGDSSVSVSFKGDILGCFQDFGHVSNIGNVNESTLKDVVMNRTHLLGNMEVCEGCNSKNAAMMLPMFLNRTSKKKRKQSQEIIELKNIS